MAKKKTIDTDIESQAAKLLSDLWVTNSDAVVFVTDRVAFRMKTLIRNLRKNYWGIFNTPNDPTTGRKKIWIPLTSSTVEEAVKNIDLDSKDINFIAKKEESIPITQLVRSAVKNELDRLVFGEWLDELERQLAIDGTVVWKTFEEKNSVTGEMELKIRLVDLLNFAIDPVVKSIQDAPGVMERALLTRDEFEAMNLPFNKENVQFTKIASRNDEDLNVSNVSSTVDMIEVFEYWGLAPESFFTGKKDDTDMVQAKITASKGSSSAFVIHDIEKNKKGWKPYEEAWYTRVHGRWHGQGIGEKLLWLQLWINTVVNIRINRSYVSQLGLFKMKKGSGVTPQMISRLAANGAVMLNNMDDLQQIAMQDASPASYNDENVIKDWAQRTSQTFPVSTGETLPASATATSAVIQARGAQSGYTMIKESIGMFLDRWLTRHAIPIIQKKFTVKNIIRLTGEPELLAEIDEQMVNAMAVKELDKIKKSGKLVREGAVEAEMERIREKLQAQGDSRFITLLQNMDLTAFDVKTRITNEDMDKGVIIQNLQAMLQTAAQLPGVNIDPADIARQMFDQMGLTPPRPQTKQREQEQVEQLQQTGNLKIPEIPTGDEQQITTAANI